MKKALLAFSALCFAGTLDPVAQSTLDRITAADLRGNLSFLASDLLEGRDTPSRGLDLAAEFIASQFRHAGLEPVMQTARFARTTPDLTNFSLTINGTKVEGKVDVQAVSAIDIQDAPLYKMEGSRTPNLEGKVVVLAIPDFRAQGGRENYQTYLDWLSSARAKHPAAILQCFEGPPRRAPAARLVDLESANQSAPTITITEPGAAKLFAEKGTVSIHMQAPAVHEAKVSNVTALLKGSDPELAKTYILVTAHYDHLGIKPEGEGDRIYNGANDDGSGTVSVIELAHALAQTNPRPKRSYLFMAFFGEEKGLLGSRYYAAHPLVPLADTVAEINLEQLGRTDDTEGPKIASATFTGFTFSDAPAFFVAAGKELGVKVYNDEKEGDAFFARSDNQSLADAGVPAHTLCVAFEYPDYHGLADEWNKIDYANMAKVDQMIALGLLRMGNDPKPPHWNASEPKAEKYLSAWKALRK